MSSENSKIHLADDHKADCLLFKDALEGLPVTDTLTTVHNGEQLIEEVTKKGSRFPGFLFPDVNMPRQNGFASLGEIKRNTDLQNLPVNIFSTASDVATVKSVFRNAAHHYICKPSHFSQMKKVIYEALTLIMQKNNALPLQKKLLITGDSVITPDKK